MTGRRFTEYPNIPSNINFDKFGCIKKEDVVFETLRYEHNGIFNDSAVKVTHIPTGEFCIGFTQRSQLRNKAEALIKLDLILKHFIKDTLGFEGICKESK